MGDDTHTELRLRDADGAATALTRSLAQGHSRWFLAVPDPVPLRDLHASGALHLLADAAMTVVVVDAALEAGTGRVGPDATDREIRAYVEGRSPPFFVAATDVWEDERGRRRGGGGMPRVNAVALAAADFLSADDGLKALLATGGEVWLLCPDDGIVALNRPPNLRLVSVGEIVTLLAAPRGGI